MVEPGTAAGLKTRTPTGATSSRAKDEGKEELAKLVEEVSLLHDRLWAEGRRASCSCCRASTPRGRTGRSSSVLTGVNPQGCRIVSFKAPSATELAHDYLWRVHAGARSAARSGSSTARTTRTWSRCACASSRPKEVWSRRHAAHPRVRAAARRRGDHRRQGVPPHVEEEQGKRLRSGSTIRRSAGSSVSATSTTARAGTSSCAAYEDAIARDLHGVGALVRRPGRPQLGAQRGRRARSSSTRPTDRPPAPAGRAGSIRARDRLALQLPRQPSQLFPVRRETIVDLLTLRALTLGEPAGDESDAGLVKCVRHLSQALLRHDCVLMGAEDILHSRGGVDDAALFLSLRAARQLRCVTHSFDLDPEPVQRLVGRSFAQTPNTCDEATQLPRSQLVELPLRPVLGRDDGQGPVGRERVDSPRS